MHKWFYSRIGDDDHIEMHSNFEIHPKNTILSTDRLLNIKHAFGNYFLRFPRKLYLNTIAILNTKHRTVKLPWMFMKCAKCNFIPKLYA